MNKSAGINADALLGSLLTKAAYCAVDASVDMPRVHTERKVAVASEEEYRLLLIQKVAEQLKEADQDKEAGAGNFIRNVATWATEHESGTLSSGVKRFLGKTPELAPVGKASVSGVAAKAPIRPKIKQVPGVGGQMHQTFDVNK